MTDQSRLEGGESATPQVSPVVIIGAGGHGREVFVALSSYSRAISPDDPQPPTFLGFIDDVEPDPDLLARLGAQWLGPTSELTALSSGTRYLLGVGSGAARKRLDDRASAAGLEAFTLVDPDASVGVDVRLSPGSIVFARATVTTNIALGRHSHVGRGVAIGHDCTLDDYTSVYPNASISGNVRVGAGATIGTGAVVRQGCSIAPGSTVGAGAVVLDDVAGVVAGVPAKPLHGPASDR